MMIFLYIVSYENKNYSQYNLKTLKVHLFYAHQICPNEEINKQNNQSSLIWQYFKKEKRYTSKCKIYNSSLTYLIQKI